MDTLLKVCGAAALLAIVGYPLIVGTGGNSEQQNERPASDITYQQYDALRVGMTYEEVTQALGRPGVVQSRDTNTVMYLWGNSGYASMVARFRDGKLVEKNHMGLR